MVGPYTILGYYFGTYLDSHWEDTESLGKCLSLYRNLRGIAAKEVLVMSNKSWSWW